jgi:hypothetical protein
MSCQALLELGPRGCRRRWQPHFDIHPFALRGLRGGLESAIEPKPEADGGFLLACNPDLHGSIRREERDAVDVRSGRLLLIRRPALIHVAPSAEWRHLHHLCPPSRRRCQLMRPQREPPLGTTLGSSRRGCSKMLRSSSTKELVFKKSRIGSSRGLRPGQCSTRVSIRSIQSKIAHASAKNSGLGAGSRPRSVAASLR